MELLEKSLVIKRSLLPSAGKGLFTKKIIPKGTRIVEYVGKVIKWKDANAMNGLNAYIYYVNRNHVIDGSKHRNCLARFANDAKGSEKKTGATNNCRYVVEGVQVFIEAKKKILANEEILVGYGKEYWDTIRANRKKVVSKKKASKKRKKV